MGAAKNMEEIMNVAAAEDTGRRNVTEAREALRLIAKAIRKLGGAWLVDGDAMCKSKDWPYLWKK